MLDKNSPRIMAAAKDAKPFVSLGSSYGKYPTVDLVLRAEEVIKKIDEIVSYFKSKNIEIEIGNSIVFSDHAEIEFEISLPIAGFASHQETEDKCGKCQ